LSGLLEDYWFGHGIQHGSGNQVNVTIFSGYVIKAKKDIEKKKPLNFYSVSIYAIGGPINPIALPSTRHQEFLSRVYLN
jgi:hypothetical protein